MTSTESVLVLTRIALDSTRGRLVRCRAVASLGTREGERASRGLIKIMRQCRPPNKGVLLEAARWLGLRRQRIVEAALIQMLSSGSTELTSASAYALGLFRSRRAAPHLRGVIEDPELIARTRAYAAEALAHLPSQQTSQTLLRCLNESSSELRYWSIFSLAELRESKALPTLRRLAKSDHRVAHQGRTVAQEARWAIGRLKGKGEPGEGT
jgi:HEAT repeat protein